MYHFMARPVSTLKGVGPTLEKRLQARNVHTLGDLLLHLPRSYLDDRSSLAINQLSEQLSARISGHIISREGRGYGKQRQVTLLVADGTGEIRLSFFHAGFMMNDARLVEGREISVRGTAERWHGQWQMTHPDWCIAEAFEPAIRPVYGALAGLNGKRVAAMIEQVLTIMPQQIASPLDDLVSDITADRISLPKAFRHTHQTAAAAIDQRAVMNRLKSEEIVVYLSLMRDKKQLAECTGLRLEDEPVSGRLLQALPFQLTPAQQQAWHDIAGDLASGSRMHRLLQGDVGAGKTWVAALAMLRAAGNGYQAALLAPTEVLAEQHAITLRQLLEPLGFSVALLTGSTRAKQRREMLAELAAGSLKLIVGTHALLTDDVVFDYLALALVDEQHRFGVKQRWAMGDKRRTGNLPVHLLGMTATPIPRSLALALYGDMDLTVMHGMPPGRKPIETRVIGSNKMQSLAAGMQRILDAGGRIYWIVPRIDEDDDGVSVDQRVELLNRYFPAASVTGLHGRMKPADKRAALDAFTDGSCTILVSTTVVEVGVNVVEARLIVIEQAESYGLAQLHQLRGRVGRSSEQGYCILVAGEQASNHAMGRLQKMVHCHDGLELAEADLALRGAGDAVGTRQHGEAGFRLLDMAEDAELIRYWYEQLPDMQPDETIQHFWRPFADAMD